jgi:hypothetical protein
MAMEVATNSSWSAAGTRLDVFGTRIDFYSLPQPHQHSPKLDSV